MLNHLKFKEKLKKCKRYTAEADAGTPFKETPHPQKTHPCNTREALASAPNLLYT